MTDSAAIIVNELQKTYLVPEREGGLKAAVASLVRRRTREVKAVDRIGFTIAPGEIVGFLGPNGAGKTTTLKMLSGLLYPSGGEARVLGYEPSRREKAFLEQITLVMGQRNQLFWDIPSIDSFDLNRAVYRIPESEFKETRDEFIELLDMQSLMNKPVRNLSLGERMKVEIAASLLHRPKVLFLDEPTIGLDVTMQRRIRHFVQEYNRRYGATVLLTSHYMADVEALCPRVVVIHHGRILYDGRLKQLVELFTAHKKIIVTLADNHTDLSSYGEIVEQADSRVTLQVARTDTPRITAQLLAEVDVDDLTVEDPPIESIIEEVFARETVAQSSNLSISESERLRD